MERVNQLDAEADELLSKMMEGQSPETKVQAEQASSDQTAEQQAAQQTDSPQTDQVTPAHDDATKQELETLQKRFADSQRKITELGQENATLRNQLADAQKQIAEYREKEFSAQSQERDQSFNAISEEYEQFKPMLEELKALREQVAKQNAEVNQVKQERDQQTAQQEHMNAILAAHPDAMQVHGSDKFSSWIATQHPRLQQVLQNGTAQEVVDLLTQFKNSSPQQAQQSKVDQAREMATPNTRSQASPNAKRTFTRGEIERMTLAEYKQLENEIDQAWAEGRVI
jgi:predicted RNase H-like nuclease (RuvC/YqgF family)